MKAALFAALILLGATGCSSVPKQKSGDPDYLLKQACKPGGDIKKVAGSLWMKVDSKEAKGQFPASVLVQEPDQLRLEVTDLIGSTQALIEIQGNRYSIDLPDKKNKKSGKTKGFRTWWGGVPLRWGRELFLGKIPCPSGPELEKATRSVTAEGVLIVSVPPHPGEKKDIERYEYHFRSRGGESWPEALHYEQKAEGLAKPTLVVDFKFDDPESGTDSPLKWEAKSTQGEVKVRWRDRDVSR